MKMNFKLYSIFFNVVVMMVVIGLSGCALEKELPPARDQSQIDKAFSDGLEGNKKLTEQKAKKSQTTNNQDSTRVLDALLPPISRQSPIIKENRFNVIVNALPARQFYMGLVEDTSTNIIVHPDVAGNITLNLKNVTISDVMMITREVYGFNYKKKGNNYFVYPNNLQTRLFRVNYINLIRSGTSSIDVSSGQITKTDDDSGSDSGNNSSRSSSTANTKFGTQLKTEFKGDLWQELAASLRTIIGNKEGRNIVVNPQTGVVLVKAMPDELLKVEEFLDETQMITGRQVLLEAKIIEVELADGFQAGINWVAVGKPSDGKTITGGQAGIGSLENAIGLGAGVPGFGGAAGGLGALGSELTSPFGGVFTLALDLNDFQAMIELLGTQGDVQVLSSPRIATMNNQKAVIKVGTDQYFVTDLNSSNTSDSDGSASDIPDVELTPFFSGVALDVTPQIDRNGEIILHIHPSISEVSEDDRDISFSDEMQISLPMAKSTIRESDSIIRAKNGQMVIIGGLMSTKATDDNSSVPFFGDIPLLGNAFKHQREVTVKSELVIMLKATYLDNDKTINDTLLETRQRFQALDKYDVSGRPSTKEPSTWYKSWNKKNSDATNE